MLRMGGGGGDVGTKTNENLIQTNQFVCSVDSDQDWMHSMHTGKS